MTNTSTLSVAIWKGLVSAESSWTRPLVYTVVALVAIALLDAVSRPKGDAPLVNPKKTFEVSSSRVKQEFVRNARCIVRRALDAFPGKCFRVVGDTGEMTILPVEYANAIRNDERFGFAGFVNKLFMPHLPGLEAFGESPHMVKMVAQRDLTKHLNKVTEPLNEETALALVDLFTDNKEWHEMPLKDTILHLISRISSRVFLGEELCRNSEWLYVTREYTTTGFMAAEQMRLWPAPLRAIIAPFHPTCRRAAKLIKQARRVIDPVLERRRHEAAKGNSILYNDAIQWFENECKGTEYDPAVSQLLLSVAAIHTTTDLLCQSLLDIIGHPAIVEPLRQEVMQCLADGGWKKTSLYNMKLLDSCIKESQRLKPISLVSMRRATIVDVELPDGTFVPKGCLTAVSSHRMWDQDLYENPDAWNGHRFYRMRQVPGQESAAQLVATSPDHLAFGHGAHACPGRFFAANEVKMALIHILLKYDLRLPKGESPNIRYFGFSMGTDPTINIHLKRRQEEINLDSYCR